MNFLFRLGSISLSLCKYPKPQKIQTLKQFLCQEFYMILKPVPEIFLRPISVIDFLIYCITFAKKFVDTKAPFFIS